VLLKYFVKYLSKNEKITYFIMSAELIQFLNAHRSTAKDEEGKSIYTHTSMGQPLGSFNIPEDRRDELHRLIVNSVFKERKAVYLTERPLPVKPITVDIDLKYPIDYSQRQHNDKHIRELLKLYATAIITYVSLPDGQDVDAYVFQRSGPYPDKGNMKDGIHIIYPDIACSTDIQHLIRQTVLKQISQVIDNPLIGKLPVKNSPDDVVDKSVISKNNWMMYGCTKPGRKPYQLYGIYRLDNSGEDMSFQEMRATLESVDDHLSMMNLLSTHMPKPVFDIREEHRGALEEFSSKPGIVKKRTYNVDQYVKQQFRGQLRDDEQRYQVEEAKRLVGLLAQWRSDDYHQWIEVGMCLHNISHSLHDTWIDFSRRSDKYRAGDCDRWYQFEPQGLNIGSLHRWARLDDPAGYKAARADMLQPLMISSVSGTTQDVAAVVHKMYQYQYVCMEGSGKKWAEFANHGWRVAREGISLKRKIGEEVLSEYLKLASHFTMSAANLELEAEKREQFHTRAQSLMDLTYKLRDITFKEKVMKECIILFHDPNFEETLDSNPYLVGMDNGVYDLNNGIFRDGRPEDMISISTHLDYPDVNIDDIDIENETSSIPEVQAIFEFIAQVLPIREVRHYMYLSLASYLQGFNSSEKFHVWTGVGGNGKSKLLEMFELAMGDYCFKLPIALLTQKRMQAGQATPELALGRNRRLGSFQEPDEGSRLNVGLMKELTGNDKLYVRGLYAEGTIMKPQFSLILLCNHKPKVPADDEGTWRRLVIIEFISRFVDEPRGRYEFPKNVNLAKNFPVWAPYFFVILSLWYRLYRVRGLHAPEVVKSATYEYRKDSDAYTAFLDEYFIKDEASVIKLDDAYAVFKEWFSNEFNEKAPNRRDFKIYIERKLNQGYGLGAKAGWKGWSLQLKSGMDEGLTNGLL
jgi:P4 family phage/plasmid primase-like protien